MSTCPMCTKWEDEPDLRIVHLEQSSIMLNRDQFFRGYCFLFPHRHVTELFHLDSASRTALMDEVSALAEALFRLYAPDKINYELLGNMVPHMHWHVVPRRRSDPLWPRPIWAEPHQELFLTPQEYAEQTAAIRKQLLNGQG